MYFIINTHEDIDMQKRISVNDIGYLFCKCIGLFYGSRFAIYTNYWFGIALAKVYPRVGEVDFYSVYIVYCSIAVVGIYVFDVV